MLKFAGIVVIILSASFAGCYFSSALKNRLVMLKKLDYMLEEIILLLRYRSATVYEIAETLAADGRFSEFEFLKSVSEGDKPFREGWREAVFACNIPDMKKSDIELIADIGGRLGSSDLEGQLGTVMLQREELRSAIRSAEEDCAKKAKLYRSLGVLFGAFVSIMLI